MDKFRQVHRHPEFIRDIKRFGTLEDDRNNGKTAELQPNTC